MLIMLINAAKDRSYIFVHFQVSFCMTALEKARTVTMKKPIQVDQVFLEVY